MTAARNVTRLLDAAAQAEVRRVVLAHLVDVCERMDLHHDRERPTEQEYKAALAAGRRAVGQSAGRSA
jgi:hypothetical protein